MLLHHDNAPAHTSAVGAAAIQDWLQTTALPAIFTIPGSIWLLCVPIFENLLCGQTFESDETVIQAINDWFEQL